MSISNHKASFIKKLSERQIMRVMQESAVKTCDHNWQTVKKQLPIDNMNFNKISAHFVLKRCDNCKTEIIKDYIVQ